MRVVLLLFLLFEGTLSYSQQYNFRSWTLEHGLPQSQVNSLLLDHNGQLWLATLGGASRFDGNTFHNYTDRQGLGSNNTSYLFQDSKQYIWIGTSDAGLTRYNGHTTEVYADKQGLTDKNITCISEDNKGRLWVATDSGVYYQQQDLFKKSSQLPAQAYNSILCTSAGTVWSGSKRMGLYKTDRSGSINYTTQNSELPHNTITTLFQDKAGTLWIGTANGLARYDQGVFYPVQLPASVTEAHVADIVQDKYKNIWIGLRKGGLLKYDGERFVHLTKQNGLRTNSIASLAADSEGTLWIGTNGHGVQQHRNPWFVHYFELGKLEEPKITALTSDNRGYIWFGTDDSQAGYLKNGEPVWLPTQNWPEGTTINNIYTWQDNNVWLCTSSGVWNIQNNRQRHYGRKDGLPADEVYHCLVDSGGSAWFATARGLVRFAGGRFSTIPLASTNTTLKALFLHRDRKGVMWVGTDKGIYTLSAGKLGQHPVLSRTPFTQVTTIAEDNKGTLYFGGFNKGVLIWNSSWKEPKLLDSNSGLPNQGITGLYVDKHQHLWIGTSRNVLKMPLSSFYKQEKPAFRTYNAKSGFRGIEVSPNAIAEAADGTMWFGTAKGATNYIPSLDQQNQVYPKIILTDVLLFMKHTNWEKLGYKTDSTTGLPVKPQLPHKQNHITIDYQGICLTGPEQVRYKYRLLGLDEEWSPVTEQSFASFSSLEPGDYEFQLLACNNDGLWMPKPLTYSFAIAPPIWRNEWFVTLMMLVIAGSFIGVVRLRERNLVKLNTLLERKVHHRTRLLEEKNREKEILLKEIHHRVKNNLQIVISLLNLQARHLQDPVELDVMQAIRSRVRSMAILHEQLYHQHDLAHIDLDDYFMGICESLYASYGLTQADVKLEFLVPPVKVDIDTAITLGLIVNELISNSFKYAFSDKGKGVLHLELVKQNDRSYVLTISDNGPGMPADIEQRKNQSFGLKLVTTLSKKLSGNIYYNNNNGTKSTLFFVLPS
ncbi:ligand-binding sensor domain-containing protein [Pontibacter ruber]|uniref:Two-component regulator propeller domain-containing protein n=1 Tax=Pontibacter ruber TaxID=1343895 RepID=A0ABW5CWL5_9BACT|nr:two-component regulator propeller domain-containing protein [Pontibacter ruber]